MKKILISLVLVLLFIGCGGTSNPSSGISGSAQCISNASVLEDTSLNLLWLNDAGAATRTGGFFTAENFCSTLVLDGCSSWRLANDAEVQSAYLSSYFSSTLSHWTNEYWLSDVAGTGHLCFNVSTGEI